MSYSASIFDFLIEQAFLAILPRVSQPLSCFLVAIKNYWLFTAMLTVSCISS